MIYLLKELETNSIKIGYVKSVSSLSERMSSLRTGNPRKMEILATLDGELKDEFSLHRRFADFHLDGEWFTFPNSFIKLIKKKGNKIDLTTLTKYRGYSSKNNTHQELILATELLKMQQLVYGEVSFSLFIKHFNRGESASLIYWKALKDRFNVVYLSHRGLNRGRSIKSKERMERVELSLEWMKLRMTKEVPIVFKELAEYLEVNPDTIKGYLKNYIEEIYRYHKKVFLSIEPKVIQSRYIIRLKVEEVKEIGLTLSELARLTKVHLNTISKHKKFIMYKFPELIKFNYTGIEEQKDLKISIKEFIEVKMKNLEPILSKDVIEYVNKPHSLVETLLKDFNVDIQSYHYKEFLTTSVIQAKNRHNLKLKVLKVDKTKLSIAKLAKELSVDYKTISSNKTYLQVKFNILN